MGCVGSMFANVNQGFLNNPENRQFHVWRQTSLFAGNGAPAAVIGISTAFVCYGAIQLRAKLKWDDALDVWAYHGVGGTLGVIMTGVFAASAVNGVSGLIEGNLCQFGVQLLAALFVIVYAFGVTWLILKIQNHFMPVRVPDAVEVKGLDVGEFGEDAYTL